MGYEQITGRVVEKSKYLLRVAVATGVVGKYDTEEVCRLNGVDLSQIVEGQEITFKYPAATEKSQMKTQDGVILIDPQPFFSLKLKQPPTTLDIEKTQLWLQHMSQAITNYICYNVIGVDRSATLAEKEQAINEWLAASWKDLAVYGEIALLVPPVSKPRKSAIKKGGRKQRRKR